LCSWVVNGAAAGVGAADSSSTGRGRSATVAVAVAGGLPQGQRECTTAVSEEGPQANRDNCLHIPPVPWSGACHQYGTNGPRDIVSKG
jgi:hypothetical protein